jgi:hypothetical protein
MLMDYEGIRNSAFPNPTICSPCGADVSQHPLDTRLEGSQIRLEGFGKNLFSLLVTYKRFINP